MAKQTVTIRLDEDDLTFLSSMELPGAANLSEKVRALLAEARAQREGLKDPASAYDRARRLFAGPERTIRSAEMDQQMRSELVSRLLAWLPEMSAALLSGAASLSEAGEERRGDALIRLERMLGERALSLLDSTLQLAVAGFPGCYEPDLLRDRSRSALRSAGQFVSRDNPEKDESK